MLLVGLGEDSWDDLHRLIDAGRLPMLARLVERGTIAALDTTGQDPAVLWAGMMTGMLPRVHGIRGAYEVRPDGGGIQPIGASAWRAAPLWQVLADAGVPATMVSCPGSAPAEAWAPCRAIDERFAAAPPLPDDDWPLAPGCIHPADARAIFRPMRVHPEEIDQAELPPRELAYTVTVHAAAIECAARTDWRFMAVCYPAMEGDAAAAFRDLMLARLIEATGGGTDVVLVSGAGVLVAAGPGFAHDRIEHGARSVDVATTVLARFGLAARNAVGSVLPGTVYGRLRTIETISPARAPFENAPPATGQAARSIDEVEVAQARHAALEAMLIGDEASAAPLLDAALARRPNDMELLLLRGQAAFLHEDAETCRSIGAALAQKESPWGNVLIGAALALAGDPAADVPLAHAAAAADGDVDMLLRLGAIALRRERAMEARDYYARALAAAPAGEPSRGLRAAALGGSGLAALMLGDAAAAERDLRASLGLHYHMPVVHQQLGLLLAARKRWPEALAALREAATQAPALSQIARQLLHVERAARLAK